MNLRLVLPKFCSCLALITMLLGRDLHLLPRGTLTDDEDSYRKMITAVCANLRYRRVFRDVHVSEAPKNNNISQSHSD
jgi:hypothetical protein